MIIKVAGESGSAFRTAGNPIRIGETENDVTTPLTAPGLNQHREAILAELMADDGAYAPSASLDEVGEPVAVDPDIYGTASTQPAE
jgi:CoA:oxalate CoA-transferase